MCSLNILFVFFKTFRKFAISPSPVLGRYWFYKILPANRSDCSLALRWELLHRCRRGSGCRELWKKILNTLYIPKPWMTKDGQLILNMTRGDFWQSSYHLSAWVKVIDDTCDLVVGQLSHPPTLRQDETMFLRGGGGLDGGILSEWAWILCILKK